MTDNYLFFKIKKLRKLFFIAKKSIFVVVIILNLSIMVKIRIIATCSIFSLNYNKINNWKSDVFKIVDNVVYNRLNSNADLSEWTYSDNNLKECLSSCEKLKTQSKSENEVDFTVFVMNIPLEQNWMSRILDQNRIVISYYEIKEILNEENIPLENYLISMLYSYSLLFLSKKSTFLTMEDENTYAHDDARGCLFDMCGIKSEIKSSCIKPIICEQCKAKLLAHNIGDNIIKNTEKELRKLKKEYYYILVDFLKKHPIWSITISGLLALILNLVANVIYGFIFSCPT